jgi:hypothetical protein
MSSDRVLIEKAGIDVQRAFIRTVRRMQKRVMLAGFCGGFTLGFMAGGLWTLAKLNGWVLP